MSELKPCPFCGADPKLEDHRTIWVVRCQCEACVLGERAPEPDGTETEAYSKGLCLTAIERWNRRSQQAQPAPSAEAWHSVATDGLPPCDGETVYLGENENGYLCTFNWVNPDGCCLQGLGDALTAQFSCLAWWRLAPTRDASPVARQPLTEEQLKEMAYTLWGISQGKCNDVVPTIIYYLRHCNGVLIEDDKRGT